MEKAVAPHASTLAWKISWTEEPGGLQSMGSLRVGLENTHETPQSSRYEGLLLLYGLESNPVSSLQTPEEV